VDRPAGDRRAPTTLSAAPFSRFPLTISFTIINPLKTDLRFFDGNASFTPPLFGVEFHAISQPAASGFR